MGVKTGGLIHLFDWNRKSRKKLFPNGNISPEGAKEGTMTNNDEQTSHSCLIEDDETRGLSSGKGNGDYSCAPSVTDEEGNGTRVPGVVARLMGLDSLPTVDVSEPYSTPLFDSRSLQENCYQKRGPEFNADDHFSNVGVRSDCYARKPLELRSQKMPSSPIERFQTEVLPPRSAKSLPMTHYKLLSPIKNPSFISGKSAAHIMEAAAKILEPGLQANAKTKAPSPGPSSLALEVQEPDKSITVSQSISRLPELSRRPVESNAIKYLRGYLTNKSWNALEDSISMRASPAWGERSFTGAKDKGKTFSLAIQAKVNVQRREGSTTSSGSPSVQRQQDEAKLNQSFKSQPSSKKMLQKNASTPGPSGVLKQNNQKQNCHVNKEKLIAKSMSNQQKKKVPSGDANSGKNRILNKIQVSSKTGYRKELQATDLEDGSSSTAKTVPRKKRLIDRNYQSEKKSSTSTILVGSHMSHVQSSVMIDEHQKWGGDGRANGANIVSFTFTSPMTKSTLGSQSTHIMEMHDMSSASVAMDGERNDAVAKNSNVPSLGLNMITGDALSVLLEQKMRELTSGLESSSSNIGKMGSGSVSAINPHLISDSGNTHIVSIECQKETTGGPCKTSLCNVSDNSLSDNDMLFNLCTGMQGVESLTECCSSGSDVHKEFEQQYPSPLSILEASFSSDSCSSSDSSDSNNGNKVCSSVEAQTYASFSKNETSGEIDVSDSAASIRAETVNGEPTFRISTYHEISEEEMEYVRDMLQNAGIDFKGMASGCLNRTLDPLLFALLENKKFSFRNRPEDNNHRLWRKVLFDFVDEFLESKHSHYFKAGFRTLAKGSFMIGRVDKFAGEIYKEISGWKRMADRMVDEVVDKDMSSHLGRWVDFEAEVFEAGVEIEKALVNCLIDEVVADFIL